MLEFAEMKRTNAENYPMLVHVQGISHGRAWHALGASPKPPHSVVVFSWECPCPMNGSHYCLKELIERVSSRTPLLYQLRWVISNWVYPIFLEMSCLTLIPGRPGPPSCPRSPAGPLGPGGPGLPRSPAGPWKERWRFTARESASHWIWNCPSKFSWFLQKSGGPFCRMIYTFSPGSPLLPGKPRKPGEPCQIKEQTMDHRQYDTGNGNWISSKLFTIRHIIMKINGGKKWKWHFPVGWRTTDYFLFGFNGPAEIIACPPLFLADPASLLMNFLK